MKLSRFSFLFSVASVIVLAAGHAATYAADRITELIHVAFPATPEPFQFEATAAPVRTIGLSQHRSFRSLLLARLPTGYAGAPTLA